MLPVVLFPFTEKSTPASRPLCLESKFDCGETPGINCVNCAKLRPLSGNSRTWLPSITLPRRRSKFRLGERWPQRHLFSGATYRQRGIHSRGTWRRTAERFAGQTPGSSAASRIHRSCPPASQRSRNRRWPPTWRCGMLQFQCSSQ